MLLIYYYDEKKVIVGTATWPRGVGCFSFIILLYTLILFAFCMLYWKTQQRQLLAFEIYELFTQRMYLILHLTFGDKKEKAQRGR